MVGCFAYIKHYVPNQTGARSSLFVPHLRLDSPLTSPKAFTDRELLFILLFAPNTEATESLAIAAKFKIPEPDLRPGRGNVEDLLLLLAVDRVTVGDSFPSAQVHPV